MWMFFVIQAKTLSLPRVADFYTEVFGLLPNGKMGTKKLEAALVNEQKFKEIYPSKTGHPLSWVADAGPRSPYKGCLL